MKLAAAAVLALATLATPIAANNAAAQGRQDFVLVNRTGYELSHIYVSPARSNDWEEDVLGDDTLEDGQSLRIRFGRSARSCSWDLKVVYADDNSNAVWKGIDLCTVARVTIRYNRRSDTTSASFD